MDSESKNQNTYSWTGKVWQYETEMSALSTDFVTQWLRKLVKLVSIFS